VSRKRRKGLQKFIDAIKFDEQSESEREFSMVEWVIIKQTVYV
jgi:hypothetical protein